jgi:hypothetical protein
MPTRLSMNSMVATIIRVIRSGCADVKNTGTVTRRDIQTATEGNREVGIVATHAHALLECFDGGLGRPGMLVAEGKMGMDEIADCLDARPARGRLPEKGPGGFGEPVRFAVAASEEKHECVSRQIFHGVLHCGRVDPLRQSTVLHERIGGNADVTQRCDDTTAPVAETVAVGGDRSRRAGQDVVRDDEVGDAGEMDVQRQDHGCRLRTLIDQLVSNPDLHQVQKLSKKITGWCYPARCSR